MYIFNRFGKNVHEHGIFFLDFWVSEHYQWIFIDIWSETRENLKKIAVHFVHHVFVHGFFSGVHGFGTSDFQMSEFEILRISIGPENRITIFDKALRDGPPTLESSSMLRCPRRLRSAL